MNYLWVGPSTSCPTGYARETKLFTPRIRDSGRGVVIGAYVGMTAGAVVNTDGITELPRYQDQLLHDVLPAYMAYTQSDAVITVVEPSVLNGNIYGKFSWVVRAGVNAEPIPASWHLEKAAAIWSCTRWGQRQLRTAGFESTYVPLAVDTKVFCPVNRLEAQEHLGQMAGYSVDDRFVVLTVAANHSNPSIKNFAGLFEAVARVAAELPETTLVVVSDPDNPQGVNLRQLAQMFGIADRVVFPPLIGLALGIPDSFLNLLYNAADVFTLISLTESFGLPALEAQAAGTPVILTGGGALAELCFSGHLVECDPLPGWLWAHGSQWKLPRVDSIVRRLRYAASQRNLIGPRDHAREGALSLDVNVVFDRYMLPALEAFEQR